MNHQWLKFRMIILMLGAALGLAAATVHAGPVQFRIIRVAPEGSGDGSSWEQAISLQGLVDRANGKEEDILQQRDVLWRKRGEHRLAKRLYNNRDWEVSIMGGFAGHETDAEQRDPEKNRTTVVLDGCPFLFTRWAHQLTVDGLTFHNGFSEDFGGAIHIAGSLGGGNNVTLSNVRFVDCTAARSGGAIRAR